MKIYQPMMFVGLGGTGCLVGTELERRLREELCGPDGKALTERGDKQPFQLPGFLQFVYADFDETSLKRLPHLSAKDPQRAALRETARATHDLLPRFDSSPEVSRMLRVETDPELRSWLPERAGEPKVAPLSDGAGQLPTVGRAALFQTLTNGLSPVVDPIREAIGRLNRSNADLMNHSGQHIHGCDVFVAFSIAGGTGTGIFYDYLHLIGQEFQQADYQGVKIYPLVVMPSAFPEGRGGGRDARLNAGRAVVDLFRLVDDQNVPDADAELGEGSRQGKLSVTYPGVSRTPVRLRTSTVQTGFLFSGRAGVEQEDLRRSMVSLIISLIGTELSGDRYQNDDYQTFAASFVNKGTARAARAPSGIGHCGVSTSLVASMTVPVDELAELIAGRLLRRAIGRLTDPRRPRGQDDRLLVQRLFEDSGIGRIWTRDPEEPTPGEPSQVPRGGAEIVQALSDRIEEIRHLVHRMDGFLGVTCAQLTKGFQPRRGAEQSLRAMDLFRLARLVVGSPEDPDPVVREGFAGMVGRRAVPPPPPPGLDPNPPRIPDIRNRMLGMSKARWGDGAVLGVLEHQDEWYRWQARVKWAEAWREQQNQWRPPVTRFANEIAALVEEFASFADSEAVEFKNRTEALYRERTGVSYLLPARRSLKDFYNDVVRRLLQDEALSDQNDESDLLLRLMGADGWRQVYEGGRQQSGFAVTHVKRIIKERVKLLFVASGPHGEKPLLPSLADVLAVAAGGEQSGLAVDERTSEVFQSALAGLLPRGFVPEGSGRLHILIVYPADSRDEGIEDFLEHELLLPREDGVIREFRAVPAESLAVVQLRSSMSLAEVPEVRSVMQEWVQAQDEDRIEDHLTWRQRLGYREDWLASTPDDRGYILFRLLCALYNGQIDVLGDPSSPDEVRLRIRDADAAVLTLRLPEYPEGVSSWGGLVQAYERRMLLGTDATTKAFAAQLMNTHPTGPPSPQFRALFADVYEDQRGLLDELERELTSGSDAWLRVPREFWGETWNAAVHRPVGRQGTRAGGTLAEIARNALGSGGFADDMGDDPDPVSPFRRRTRKPRGTARPTPEEETW
ncbi:tubulin-like doman-containing protein [Yinghuangia seranimata]|uniref:tubulin-like doman-containing protein n=1 Tax=Yinghuangia seranimata TaxID=408067 RepID=UPI00248A9744|nr:tubulin-like doman-containing protein [Yinghuangia seranimata]MDI2130365.1 tubulin-like doman-containing protein [Yinghuangia seranimata]